MSNCLDAGAQQEPSNEKPGSQVAVSKPPKRVLPLTVAWSTIGREPQSMGTHPVGFEIEITPSAPQVAL